MTKPRKPDSPHRIQLQFRKLHRDEPERELVLVMQRFAARVCHVFPKAVVKGGLGLELRLDTPRTTKDVDIIIAGSHDLDAMLSETGLIDLGDFMRFLVSPSKNGSDFTAPGMLYPAKRYRVQGFFTDSDPRALASSKVYRGFQLEISIREAAEFDTFESTWEGFPQVPPVPIRIYSLSWQVAEKIHAYSDPRHRDADNPDMWRPRDLLDLCRCATATTSAAKIDAGALRAALEQTFAKRKAAAKDVTLPDLPDRLPAMPVRWESAFSQLVTQAALPWATPGAAHEAAATFIDPVLAGTAKGVWRSNTKTWAEE
jgi:hypothetical protein